MTRALRTLRTKRQTLPPKKHGNNVRIAADLIQATFGE